MIKLLKWMYELGEKHGWDKAVEASRKGHLLRTTEETEYEAEINEAMMKAITELPQQDTPKTKAKKSVRKNAKRHQLEEEK